MNTRLILPVLLLTAAAFAQSATDQVETLQPFVGNFKCSGKAFAAEKGPEHGTQATVTVKWALNAKWLEVHYTEEKNSRNPNPYAVVAYWGYDEGSKKFVAPNADNQGGWSVAESTGWNGDQLVWTGPAHMGAMTAPGRDTFVRKGADFTHAFEIQAASGGWKKLDEETCKK